MTRKCAWYRTFVVFVSLGLITLAAVSAAQAGVVAPKNIAGAWEGRFRGAGAHGDIAITITQTDTSGSYTGTAHDVKTGETIPISGSFSMDGRKFVGTITVAGGGLDETDDLLGRCNNRVTRLNVHFRTMTHRRVGIHLTKTAG